MTTTILTSKKNNSIILALSLPLIVLVTVVSYVGLFTPDFYTRETLNWQAQAIGQDMVDLFIAMPFLLVTTLLAYRKNMNALLMWGGVLLYFIYTFTIYAFDTHFNSLFILYCLTLGLSFYSFLYFALVQRKQQWQINFKNRQPVKVTAIYLIVISILFYFLWLSDIVPAILNKQTPKGVLESGLPTNPVHVIDLAFFLPALFITGVLMLKQKTTGYILAPVFLVFFILMDITIGALIVVMKLKEIQNEMAVAYSMFGLAMFSIVLLFWYLANIKIFNTYENSDIR